MLGPPVSGLDVTLPDDHGAAPYDAEASSIRLGEQGVGFDDEVAQRKTTLRAALAHLAAADTKRSHQDYGLDPHLQVHADAQVAFGRVLEVLAVARSEG